MSSKRTFLFFILLLFVVPKPARAISLDPSSFTSPAQFITDQAATASAKAIGLGIEFKPITGVDPPSSLLGFEIGLSVQVAKVPDEFRSVLKDGGFTSTAPAAIPAARLQANLRLGERVAVEGGWLKVNDFKLSGIALKVKIVDPEEGFGSALRLAYCDNDLGIVSTKTWTPALIFGSRLSFAEPYFGAAYSFATAKVEIPVVVGPISTSLSATGKAQGLSIFGGLVFNIAVLQLGFEGNYSNAGVPGLTARLGMRF